MAKAERPIDRTYAPQGMRREIAAWYVGLSGSKFDQLVADGRMPKGALIDGCRVWDRRKLDDAFDDLMEPRSHASIWDQVR